MTTVLVVEDESGIRAGIIEMLLLAGYDAIAAENGKIALQKITIQIPDLVISDILMPEIDGFELFRILKQDVITAAIPFIFLSSLADYGDVREGMNLGADDYLTKPFDYDQLIDGVEARLRKNANEELLRFRQLAEYLITTRDEERANIAEMLQKNVLAALNGLYLLQNDVGKDPNTDAEAVRQNISSITQNTVEIINHLQPMLLPQLSVSRSLQWIVTKYRNQHGLAVELQTDDNTLQVEPNKQRLLFDIVEASLDNIIEHAQTKRAIIKLKTHRDACLVEISDDGVGFDLTQLHGGASLQSLREKTRMMGELFRIISAPDQGTRVSLRLRLTSPEPNTPKLPNSKPVTSSAQTSRSYGEAVIIADDHEVIAEGLSAVIATIDGFAVATTVADNEHLVAAIEKNPQSIIFIDAMFDNSHSLTAIQALKLRWPTIRVIILSPYDDTVYANEVMRKGVDGYLLKNVRKDEISDALNHLVNGKQYISTQVREKFKGLRQPKEVDKGHSDVLNPLTFREREIFYMVLDGYTSSAIGKLLSISPRTVEAHRRNFMKKLDIKSINELHRFATRYDLLPSK